MKLNVSTDATSSCANSVLTKLFRSPHVLPTSPRQIVCTIRIFDFGGASVPTYFQFTGVPSSKFHAYANHSVGSRSAGSEISKPWKLRPWASVLSAELNPPIAVGGTFATVTEPIDSPSPFTTEPCRPVIRTLSTNHHQSSALSYRKRNCTLEAPPTSVLSFDT